MSAGLFLIGVCSAGRWTVTYIYLIEFWTERNIKRFGPYVNASAALALIMGAFTFQVLTRNTQYLEYFAAILTILSGVAGFCLLPESPKWLVSLGRMEQARQAYVRIAKANGMAQMTANIDQWQFKQETVDEDETQVVETYERQSSREINIHTI